MGKLIRNGIEYGGGNGTDIFEVTQAEYDALKQAGTLVHNALYVISDAPNLNPTADDIEYSSGVTVADSLDSLNTPNELNIDVASGITSVSKAYQISDKVILINFECTIATASNNYVQCFTIDWATAFSTSNFAVVSDGGTYQSYIQGYYSGDKIIVRINEPKATKYRGQLYIIAV